MAGAIPKRGHKTLTAAASLANLLPTGTALTFQTLIPSFSNNGTCQPTNQILTVSLISLCAAACFFSSFTDSFVGTDGEIYYGIATANGLFVFNDDPNDEKDPEDDIKDLKSRYKVGWIDFVHGFVSLVVFLVFAVSSSDVRTCLIPEYYRGNLDSLIMNLPVGVGILASFLFVIFPTKRRGIGCADMANTR